MVTNTSPSVPGGGLLHTWGGRKPPSRGLPTYPAPQLPTRPCDPFTCHVWSESVLQALAEPRGRWGRRGSSDAPGAFGAEGHLGGSAAVRPKTHVRGECLDSGIPALLPRPSLLAVWPHWGPLRFLTSNFFLHDTGTLNRFRFRNTAGPNRSTRCVHWGTASAPRRRGLQRGSPQAYGAHARTQTQADRWQRGPVLRALTPSALFPASSWWKRGTPERCRHGTRVGTTRRWPWWRLCSGVGVREKGMASRAISKCSDPSERVRCSWQLQRPARRRRKSRKRL